MKYLPKNLAEGLIYSDPNFVALLYETKTGTSPSTQISNDMSFDGKISVGLGSIGGSTKETRSFKLSSFGMIQAISEDLEAFPDFDSPSLLATKIPQTCWQEGSLVTGEWRSTKSGGEESSSRTFELMVGEDHHTLVAQRDLFQGGMGFLTELEDGLTLCMNIPVLLLGRVLFFNETLNTYITSPYLIVHADS